MVFETATFVRHLTCVPCRKRPSRKRQTTTLVWTLTTCAALLVAGGLVEQGAAEVTNERPRMLVTKVEIQPLRDKCLGPGRTMFEAMKKRADGMMRTKAALDNNGRHYLPTYAAMFLITGERRYADKAKQWLDLLSEQTIENPWTCLEYIPAAAVAYDWIYPTLTQEEKERFADGMVRQVTRIKKLWRHSDYNNHFLLEHMSELHVGLALAHEDNHQEVYRAYLTEGETWLKEHVIPAMNEMAGDDGGDAEGFSYANWGVERPLALRLLAWRSATGEDLFEKCTFLRWMPRWNVYGCRPDGVQCRSEDCPSSHRWAQGVKATFAISGAAYGDPLAQWAHDRLPFEYPQLIWRHLIPWNAEIPAQSPAELPLATAFRPLGHVYTRSEWDNPDATWAMFQCGPIFAGHQHLDNNSFVIFKRGSLAIDSGVNEYSSHRANYYSRSVAHNTILVYDQDETFPEAVWSSQGTGGANDGGQRRVEFPSRVAASEAEKALRDVGRIVAFANRKEYCYACGDATKSYSAGKLKHFTRQFVHLRPDTFVIFDRVVAGSASHPKTWLLHSIHEPVFPDQGPTFRIEHGGGRLDVWTLLPEDAAATPVGGPGKEYWVDGKNYPPDQTRDPEAGAWRVEVKPTHDSAVDFFLHVLVASDAHGGEHLPRVELGSVDNETAAVEITDGINKATVQFRTKDRTGGHIVIAKNGRTIVEEPLATQIDLSPAE